MNAIKTGLYKCNMDGNTYRVYGVGITPVGGEFVVCQRQNMVINPPLSLIPEDDFSGEMEMDDAIVPRFVFVGS